VTAPTAIVHLVRKANGMEPFESFMRSFGQHEAGHEHELVLLFKGFESPAAVAPYRRLGDRYSAQELHVADDGTDLSAYLSAARQLPHGRLCFVNSYSTIVAPGWLRRLSEALDEPRAGVVGATGSWGSHRSFALSLLHLPNGYRGALGDRRVMGQAFRSVGTAPRLGRLRRLAKAARDLPREIVGFPGFPAPHVRTNAFLIERELLLALRAGRLVSKYASYRFEGGGRGLTAQVAARGLTPLVVGRDGEPLSPERWPDADIFWQATQRDLLVADNQTRAYSEGTPAERLALSRYAWGHRARPG
jgi:hypothetical protein